MSEDALVMLIAAFWAMLAVVIYQRLFVIRPLRRKLDRILESALNRSAGGPVLPQSMPPEDESEMRKIRARLQVLERLAVEKDDHLTRQIEELRDR